MHNTQYPMKSYQTKEQEKMKHKLDNNQLREIDLEITEIVELLGKDVTANIYIYKIYNYVIRVYIYSKYMCFKNMYVLKSIKYKE